MVCVGERWWPGNERKEDSPMKFSLGESDFFHFLLLATLRFPLDELFFFPKKKKPLIQKEKFSAASGK